MLIILGGLPGAGKTTIARELARQIGAVHLRIDSIEQALRDSDVGGRPFNDAGYRVGYAVAEDNLRVGRTVIADSVNPIQLTRDAWMAVATRTQTVAIEIEVVCSDSNEHRRRLETRANNVQGSQPLTWRDVASREYSLWHREHIVIDNASHDVEHIVAIIRAKLAANDHDKADKGEDPLSKTPD